MPNSGKAKRGQMFDSKIAEAPAEMDAENELNEWIGRNQKRIYNLAYQYLRSREEAEDITQETFLRAYKKRESFRGEAKIDTWLTRIAINLCIDVLRKKKIRRTFPWPKANTDDEENQQLQEFPDSKQDLEEQTMNRDLRERVYKAMDKLSSQQRMVFVLKHLQDLSLKEIAETTGLSEGTIKSQLFRGVRKIRHELEGIEK